MNSNRLAYWKFTLLEGYSHEQQNFNDILPSHLWIEGFFFLMVSQWMGDSSLQWGLCIPELNFHWALQISKLADREMFGQTPGCLPNHTSVRCLVFPRQVHTTSKLLFPISLVFSVTLILFLTQGCFRKTTTEERVAHCFERWVLDRTWGLFMC